MTNNNMPQPILITGAARSGTSMVAGVINMCGAFGGLMSGSNKNNEKGMFENARIRNQILKPYLRNLGVDRLGQYPLPDINKMPIPSDWRIQIERIIKMEGYSSGPWMYKGAKMCLTWPVWHYAFPDAKWIIVRRRTGDIVNSCIKTNFMRAFQRQQFREAIGVKTEQAGWLWWVHEHEKRFVEMINEGLNVKVIWPDRMVSGNYSQIYETIEWLGLKWNDKVVKILEFVDPKLWHSRKSQQSFAKTPKIINKSDNKPINKNPSPAKNNKFKVPFNPIELPERMKKNG